MTERRTGTEADWAEQLLDLVDRGIDAVRSRTTDPLLRIVRAVVFGLMAFGVVVVALLVTVIAGVRLLDAYLPGDVWSAHLVLGGIFVAAGLLCWKRRIARA